jgi:hypothetical protein
MEQTPNFETKTSIELTNNYPDSQPSPDYSNVGQPQQQDKISSSESINSYLEAQPRPDFSNTNQLQHQEAIAPNEITSNTLDIKLGPDFSNINQVQQQENRYYDPNLAKKPIGEWSEEEIELQQEYAREKIEQEISSETAKEIKRIEEETEKMVLDIAGETYVKMTQEIGLSEQEAVEKIGKDKMTKILGKERVQQIQDNFDREVMVESMKILGDAFEDVNSAINTGIVNLGKNVQNNHRQ